MDAPGKRARWLLRLSELELHVGHRAGMEKKAADALLLLKKGVTDPTESDDDLLEMVLSSVDWEKEKINDVPHGSSNLVHTFQQCHKLVYKTSSALVEVPLFIHTTTTLTLMEETPTLKAFQQKQASDRKGQPAIQAIELQAKILTYKHDDVLGPQAPVNRALH